MRGDKGGHKKKLLNKDLGFSVNITILRKSVAGPNTTEETLIYKILVTG
jgi:hypothetical protein